MSVLWCHLLSDITSAVFVIDVPSSAVCCLTMFWLFPEFNKLPTDKQYNLRQAKHHNLQGSSDADPFNFRI